MDQTKKQLKKLVVALKQTNTLINRLNYHFSVKDKDRETKILQIGAELNEFLNLTGYKHHAKFLKWRSINSKKIRSLK